MKVKKTFSVIKHLSALVVASLLLSACAVTAPPAPTADLSALSTQIAAGIYAQSTQQALETLAAQLTQAAVATATNTAEPPAPTETPTDVPPTATATPIRPTNTPVPLVCNAAQLVSDVTVKDGTIFEPGESFTKTWRVKNVGTCTWNRDYVVRFDGGNNLADKKTFRLSEAVSPGETVDISIKMTAPNRTGSFRSNWHLESDKGEVFGVGSGFRTPIYADIRVMPVANPGFAYDFAANACSATWRSAKGVLPCPGKKDDGANGFVVLLNEAELETRNEDDLTIWVHPSHGEGGYIRGTYPAITIKKGQHFIADVGCLAGNKNCSLRFTLDYINPNGKVVNLGTWSEVLDGGIREIDIDLSSLAGKSVQFVLTVQSRNISYNAANGFWFLPSIQKP